MKTIHLLTSEGEWGELPGDSGSAKAVCFPRSVRLGSGEKMPEVARPRFVDLG